MKKVLGVIAPMLILAGCKDSGTPTVTAGSLPSLVFSNGKSQITLYRNKVSPVSFSCHPEIVVEKIEVNGVEIDSSSFLTHDWDCSDSVGHFQTTQEMLDNSFSINIFTKVGTQTGVVSQVFIKDPVVEDAPVLDTLNFSLNEDQVLNDSITYSSPDQSPVDLTVIKNPENGVLVFNSDGSFSYTPNTNYNGSDFFSIEAINEKGITQKSYSLTVVSVNDRPEGSDQSYNILEDTSQAVSLQGTDIEGEALTYSIVSAPTNGSLSGAGADRTYTPNPNYYGVDSFTYIVNDSAESSDIKTISFNISPVNDAPLDISRSISLNEDGAVSASVVSSDAEGDAISYTITTNPSNGNLSGTLPSLTYTPSPNYNGVDSFVVSISDGVNSTVSTITLTVNSVNDQPSGSSQVVNLQEDESKGVVISGNDIDGQSLTYIIVSNPSNGSLSGVAPSLTYTPNTNYNGVDSFIYKVNDGVVDSPTYSVSLNISAIDDDPVADGKNLTLNEDGMESFSLSGTDPEGASLTYSIVSNPTQGTLSGSIPNLTYTPNANYNGLDSLTYTVNDGVNTSAVATINFNINSINDEPEVQDVFITIDEDQSENLSLTGTDIEGDSLIFHISEGPQHGSLSGEAPNYTYTPDENYNGVDSFKYYAHDGEDGGAEKTVQITINPVNDTPQTFNHNYETEENVALNFSVFGYDVDGDSLTVDIVQNPTNGTLSGSGSTITYTPNSSFTGTDTIDVRVYDGQEYSEVRIVSILVKDATASTRQCSIIENSIKIGDGTESTSDGGTTWSECEATSCIDGYDVIAGKCETLKPEPYIGEGYFMDHNKLDGTTCDSSECVYSGDKLRVETKETNCSGLTLTDSQSNFIWTCEEEGGLAIFYSRINLNKNGLLKSSIDFNNLEWKKTKLNLTGASQTATQSVDFSPWKDEIRPATNILSQDRVVYVIEDSFRGSIRIVADNVALVGDYHFNNRTTQYTSNCLLLERCHIQSNGRENLYFEVEFKPELEINNSGVSSTIGVLLTGVNRSYVMDSVFTFLKRGLDIDLGQNHTVYRTQFFNNYDSLMTFSSNNSISKSVFSHSDTAAEIYGNETNLNSNTFLNNEKGLFFRGDSNSLKNSVFIENDEAVNLDQYDNGIVSNLVIINNEAVNLEVEDSENTLFEFNFSFNETEIGRECTDRNSDNFSSDCSSSWNLELPMVEISTSSLFDIGSYNLGAYSSITFSRESLIIPNTIDINHKGTYEASENSINFNVYDLKFNPNYFTADFKIHGKNTSTDPVSPDTVPTINSTDCDGPLLDQNSDGSLALAIEMPMGVGNNNGLCEPGENCEYVDQYGGVMKNTVFTKSEVLCQISGDNIKVYPSQK